jgi:voltage-gated sodium channel
MRDESVGDHGGGGILFLQVLTESWLFKSFILACIIANAATLGIEANFGERNPWHEEIRQLDSIFLAIFTLELILEFLAQGFRRYVRNGWNLFDVFVVGISYLSLSSFSALRTLRVLRVLRLFSGVPQLRRVVEALLQATPGILAAVMVLSIVFYIGSVMATTLFGESHPELFGDLGASALTLFQLTQFDGWGDLVREVDDVHPYAWIFFIVFAIVGAFAVLNLFIGVIVDAVQETRDAIILGKAEKVEEELHVIEVGEKAIAQAQARQAETQRQILEELRAVRAELVSLRGTGSGSDRSPA